MLDGGEAADRGAGGAGGGGAGQGRRAPGLRDGGLGHLPGPRGLVHCGACSPAGVESDQ